MAEAGMWDQNVVDENGVESSLQSHFESSWVLLVLLRHAECIECSLLLHELNQIHYHLQQWGVKLILVGNGDSASLTRLRQRFDLEPQISLFADSKLEMYKKLQLHNGFMRAWGLKATIEFIKALQNGHMQTKLAPHMGQQSGVVLLSPSHEILWIHRSKHLGDIPSSATILQNVLQHCASAEESGEVP